MSYAVYTELHRDTKYILKKESVRKVYDACNDIIVFNLTEEQETFLNGLEGGLDWTEVTDYLTENNIGYESLTSMDSREIIYIDIDKFKEFEEKYSHFYVDDSEEVEEIVDYFEEFSAYLYYDSGLNERIIFLEDNEIDVEEVEVEETNKNNYGYWELFKTKEEVPDYFNLYRSSFQGSLPTVGESTSDYEKALEIYNNL